jgi:hypothetical protein
MYIQFTLCVTHSSQLNTIQYNGIKKLHCVIHITVDQNKIHYVQYIQASFSPGFAQQIMPYLLGIMFPVRYELNLYSYMLCRRK